MADTALRLWSAYHCPFTSATAHGLLAIAIVFAEHGREQTLFQTILQLISVAIHILAVVDILQSNCFDAKCGYNVFFQLILSPCMHDASRHDKPREIWYFVVIIGGLQNFAIDKDDIIISSIRSKC